MLKGGPGEHPPLMFSGEPVRIVRQHGPDLVTIDYFGEDGRAQWAEAVRAMQWHDTQPGALLS